MTTTATRAADSHPPAAVGTGYAPRPPTPRWWGDTGGLLAAASLLVVTVMWLGGRGAIDLAGGGSAAVSSAGRLTGLLAADLLLIQVLLMARVPLVERAFGQDRLARWHRLTGFASFYLMAAHIVLITIGYAAGANVFAQFWDMIVTYPGVLLALASVGLLVMVVVTSMRAARRRLRYESWHLLHLYAYLGVGPALPHQLWTGTDFAGSPLARAYWWSLYGVSAGAVLIYRVGLPLWRSHRHRLTVSHILPEGPGLTSVYLKGRRLDRLPVRAGQFFHWRFLDGPGWSRSHPYSLSGTPRGDLVRITVKNLGDGSARVATLQPGTRVLFEGPYGKLTGERYRGGPVVLLACGIGITPLLALLWDLPYGDGEATLIYRARSEEETAFRRELEWLAEHRGLRVLYLLGPRADRPSWLPRAHARRSDLEALREAAPDIRNSHIYICGPDEWTAAVRVAAQAAGVTAGRLHTEQFNW
ncbi:ferric reductase-like transmembrane domain-containing protein [Streptosporangiaceae bacterium NEAU-GS5]|nr:ferric reductase-like transmembrane domain-containing protein [Streptosporangiaceae bacterium NEAU-GS5]